MKILHVLDHSLPLQSGYVYRTLGILGAQHGFGWQVQAVTTPRQNPATSPVETIDGWTFHRTARPAFALARLPILREFAEMWATARRLRQLIAQDRPDVIHAHSPVLNALPAICVGRRLGIPVVYEVRALWEDAAVDLGHSTVGGLRYRATRALDSLALRWADGIVPICQGLRDEFISRGISAGKMEVVPNAVDRVPPLEPDRGAGNAMRERLGIDGKFVIGFVGSFYHYEGLELLIAAAKRLRDAIPNLHILLVGGGPEDARLRAMVASDGLESVVTFTGRVPHAEVPAYYRALDLCVCPRLKIRLTDLVTPLKPLEAMSLGVPVLASDVGGQRELVTHDRTGLLFKAGDEASLVEQVARLYASENLRRGLVSTAHAYVARERNWPACAASYRSLYSRLTRTHSA